MAAALAECSYVVIRRPGHRFDGLRALAWGPSRPGEPGGWYCSVRVTREDGTLAYSETAFLPTDWLEPTGEVYVETPPDAPQAESDGARRADKILIQVRLDRAPMRRIDHLAIDHDLYRARMMERLLRLGIERLEQA